MKWLLAERLFQRDSFGERLLAVRLLVVRLKYTPFGGLSCILGTPTFGSVKDIDRSFKPLTINLVPIRLRGADQIKSLRLSLGLFQLSLSRIPASRIAHPVSRLPF